MLQVEDGSAGSVYWGEESHWVQMCQLLLDVCSIRESGIKCILTT